VRRLIWASLSLLLSMLAPRAGATTGATLALDGAGFAVASRSRSSAKNPACTAPAPKSGRLAGFMGGSVTRQLLRASVAPVLVLETG
jgi:nucleotide-binding universal stress UspA family protein